jgi:hypothetical protein
MERYIGPYWLSFANGDLGSTQTLTGMFDQSPPVS